MSETEAYEPMRVAEVVRILWSDGAETAYYSELGDRVPLSIRCERTIDFAPNGRDSRDAVGHLGLSGHLHVTPTSPKEEATDA